MLMSAFAPDTESSFSRREVMLETLQLGSSCWAFILINFITAS